MYVLLIIVITVITVIIIIIIIDRVFNTLRYIRNEMVKQDRILCGVLDNNSQQLMVELQISLHQRLECVRSKIIEYHYEYCSTYFFIDIKCSEWSKCRPFLTPDRCNYGVQVWYYYLKGICHDLHRYCNSEQYNKDASEIFGELLLKTSNSLLNIYRNIYPSRIRVQLYQCDILNIISNIRSFRDIVPSCMKQEINQLCIKLAVHMSIMNCSLIELYHYLMRDNITSLKENSDFIQWYMKKNEDVDENDECRGLPDSIWNSKKYNGNSFLEIEQPIPMNMELCYPLLLCGCYCIGIDSNELMNRIRYRPEFFQVVPNDYPPLSNEEKQQVELLLEKIL
jgi:hypothetical protein